MATRVPALLPLIERACEWVSWAVDKTAHLAIDDEREAARLLGDLVDLRDHLRANPPPVDPELARLRELVKSKTPATLTQAQAERMPPEAWHSREDFERERDRRLAAEREVVEWRRRWKALAEEGGGEVAGAP